jgi:hypothetical protein
MGLGALTKGFARGWDEGHAYNPRPMERVDRKRPVPGKKCKTLSGH